MAIKKLEEIISDEEIDKVHANANFGSDDRRTIIAEGLLKVAVGFHVGHTIECIMYEHGLIKRKRTPAASNTLTVKGRNYLRAAICEKDFYDFVS